MGEIKQEKKVSIGPIKIEQSKLLKIIPVLAIFAIPDIAKNGWISSLFILALLRGAMGASFDLSAGYLGIVNFGYAAFVGLGAYTSALLMIRMGITPWIGMLIGATVAAVVGFLVGLLTLRLRGIFMACFAWFFAEALKFTYANLVDITRGYLGLHVPPFPSIGPISFITRDRLAYYHLILFLTAVTLITLYYISNTRLGLAWRAIKGNEEAAKAVGVNTTLYKTLNFAISCFFAGILGGFYAHYISVLTPDVMALPLTVEVLTVCYVGGRGTLWGSLIGGFILVLLLELLRPLLVIRLVIYGALLIAVMVLYPDGIAKLIKKYVW